MPIHLKEKIVFITGASSGIGKATAEECAKQGANLILSARRLERLNELSDKLTQRYDIKALPIALDVQNKAQVLSTIENLPETWKQIDILVNNAGLALETKKLHEGSIEQWETMIQTNVCGLLYLTRTVLPTMIAKNSGHIINIGSIAGHEYYPGGNVYSATKHAVQAINKSLRLDLLGQNIRVTEVSPAAVHTEFSEVRWNDKKRSDEFYQNFTALTAADIADAIVYCATRPLHVNVEEIIITPTDQASANHIHRS